MARSCVLLAVFWFCAGDVACADPQSPSADHDLVRAHREKVAGATLIAAASTMALASAILFIVAVWPEPISAECPSGPDGCMGRPVGPSLAVSGSVLLGASAALVSMGVPLYVVGGQRRLNAERSRPTLTVAPQIGPQSASLSARVRF